MYSGRPRSASGKAGHHNDHSKREVGLVSQRLGIFEALSFLLRTVRRIHPLPISKEREARAVDAVASHMHDHWRTPRRLEDGRYEPRPKKTSDQEWIAKNGTDEVDIANTNYENLPADRKKEIEASASVAVGLTADGLRSGQKVSGSAFVESASAKVHEAWLKRNGEGAPPEQQLPYAQLSETEKAKDRVFVLKALEILGAD
jgi:hypothetical protein